MARRQTLDLDLLKEIDSGSFFMRLTSDLEDALKHLPSVAAHFDAGLKFCWFIGAGKDYLHAEDPQLQWRREACLRAVFSEFSCIDNAVVAEAKRLSVTPAPTSHSSLNPAVHLFRELRNLELHLAPSRLARAPRTFLYVMDGKERTHETEVSIVEDLTLDRIGRLDNAKRYAPGDLRATLDWLNAQQDTWGISEVVRVVFSWRAVEVVSAFQGVTGCEGAG